MRDNCLGLEYDKIRIEIASNGGWGNGFNTTDPSIPDPLEVWNPVLQPDKLFRIPPFSYYEFNDGINAVRDSACGSIIFDIYYPFGFDGAKPMHIPENKYNHITEGGLEFAMNS